MAPTRPARGAAKENGTAADSAAASGEAPVKRGRGRPPKNGVAPQAKKAPTGRPRGRPPGSGAGVKKATKKPAPKSTSGPGRRGRPRKSDASAVATPKKAATPKSSASKTSSTGKGRGRPRKSDASAVNEPEEKEEESEEKDEDEDDAAANDDLDMDDAADDDNDAADDDDVPNPEVGSHPLSLPM
ncbi:hypothetical protein F5Y13DRAFT_164710 [Hypoxylon sp. FL1857]|nr:hypothetical protein F5Y13DRAFT_164710 [Hypoxylon sp. FL1857]